MNRPVILKSLLNPVAGVRQLLLKLCPPEMTPAGSSIGVLNLTRWELCEALAEVPGVVITRKPRILGSSADPDAEFQMDGVEFQIGTGGEFGGDYLWIESKDGQAHDREIGVLRKHLTVTISKLCGSSAEEPAKYLAR